MKKRSELELTLLLKKLSDRYPKKIFGKSKINFNDLYNNSDIIFYLQEKHNFKNFGDLIKVFDNIVDDFRSCLDDDYCLTFEDYYQNIIKKGDLKK